MKKIDMVKILSITGTILGMAGSALSSYASDKNMEKLINEKVKEAIDKINKYFERGVLFQGLLLFRKEFNYE